MARKKKSYQLGSISQHNGLYTVRYWLVNYNTSKRVRKREILPGATGKKEARELAKPIIDRVNQHNNNPQAEKVKRTQQHLLTFEDFLNGRWEIYMSNEKIADSTRYSYDSTIRNHICRFSVTVC